MNGFVKKNRKAIIKGGAILGLLAVMFIIPHYPNIWDNAFSIPLLIFFWLGVTFLVLPEFFKKYRILIFSIYGLVIAFSVFFYYTTPNHLQDNRLILINLMFLPIPLFITLWGYEQWRWLKTLKADKAKAELTLLKSQINPHFFFNTLNNLYGLTVEKSEHAPAMILKLSDIMRYTIYNGKEDYVPLSEEINYIEDYLELQKIRYQKKVDINFYKDIDQTTQVAPLLFIVLLENAFKHGVESLTENAYIYLNLKTHDNKIFFSIENNYESNISEKSKGIGLDNLRKRLVHLYPNQHEFKIEKTDSKYSACLNIFLNA